MTVTIHVNGSSNSLVHKGSNGIASSTAPDVCQTPSPAGPVPIPYPVIVSMSSDLENGTITVTADGGNMIAIKDCDFSRCTGDEAGTGGGLASGTFGKEAKFILYSFDVKIEGGNACRLADKMTMNHQNTVCLGGVIQAPVIADDLKTKLLQCDEAKTRYSKAKAANGGSDPTIAIEPSVIGTGGSVNTHTGRISIDKVNKAGKAIDQCQQVETLCFELGNLSKKADFDTADKLVNTGTRDEYCRAQEKVEYDNANETQKITEACKDKWGCPKMKSQFEWVKGAKDFDDYFKHFLSKDHIEHYGKHWDSVHP